MTESKEPKATDGAVLIMSCDRYQPFWDGLYHYMEKFWDYSIPWPIYFCTEDRKFEVHNPKWKNIRLGKAPFHILQRRALDILAEFDTLFFMLEDFWPSRPMTSSMFLGLYDLMKENQWDCLHIDSMRPDYYKVMPTPYVFQGQKILQLTNDSDWFFNQQAGFWKRELLMDCCIEPKIYEDQVSTTLSFEKGCDEYLKTKHPDAKIMLHHYWWYPRAGVSWRGQLSLIGQEMEAHMNIDKWCSETLNLYDQ